jgi:hypothetical protein
MNHCAKKGAEPSVHAVRREKMAKRQRPIEKASVELAEVKSAQLPGGRLALIGTHGPHQTVKFHHVAVRIPNDLPFMRPAHSKSPHSREEKASALAHAS